MSVLSVCVLLDVPLLLAGAVLAWRVPVRSRADEFGRLLLFAGASALVLACPTRMLGSGFGMLRGLAHAIFCVILPTFAVRGVRIAPRWPWLAAMLWTAFVGGELAYVWAREVEPFRLEVTRREIVSERLADTVQTLGRPLRVACIADLQTDVFGRYEESVFDEVVAYEPDVVLLLGDYLQCDAERARELLPRLREQLARIAAPRGIYAVDGDVDGNLGGVHRIFAGTRVTPLVDGRARLPDLPVEVIGLSRRKSRVPFVDIGTARRLAGGAFPIVIGHAPDYMLSVIRQGYRPDALMVAGHTHGGQVQIPWFGPIVTLSSVPRWLAGGGVFRRGRAWLACSRGIGMERSDAPRIRFHCRPQLLLLDLHD